MNITDQAKKYIQQAMENKQVYTLRFYGIHGCGGVNLGVALQEAEANDVIEQINGISIAFQGDMKEDLINVTVDIEKHNGDYGIVLNGYQNTPH